MTIRTLQKQKRHVMFYESFSFPDITNVFELDI